MTAIAPVSPVERPLLPPRQPFGPHTPHMWEDTGLITHALVVGSGFVVQTMEASFDAVAQAHSDSFRTDPTGRALRGMASMMTWIYGGQAGLDETDRLRNAHTTLNTVDEAGTRHTALAAGAWAWVLHATFNAQLTRNRYFGVRPLDQAGTEAYFQEFVQLLINFRVPPKHIPDSYTAWHRWFDDQVRNNLTATRTAHEYLEVIGTIAAPNHLPASKKLLWRAAALLSRRVLVFTTVGTLPPAARDKLGLVWTDRDERRLRRWGRLVSRVLPHLPERVRYLPIAYEARRVERDNARLHAVLAARPR